MFRRSLAAVVVSFAATLSVPFACSPQVVDAVDPADESGGAGTTGGSGSGGALGGSAGSGLGGTSTCPGGDQTDRDGDGVPDCADGCPDDPLKTSPVTCGCGIPDSPEDGGIYCLDLQPLLAHRYRFDGIGTTAYDSVPGGNANGEIVNTELSGHGTVVLGGGTTDQYVNLPNRIVSTLHSVTLEAWLEWNGGGAWQRIYDFGEELDSIEDAQSSGRSYLFLTPRTLDQDTADPTYQGPYLRAVYGRPLGANVVEDRASAELNVPRVFPSGRLAHVAVVVDGDAGSMFVYIDGTREGAFVPDPGDPAHPPIDMTRVNDINCWLGRSQFVSDPELDATFYDFRIYAAALTAEQIELSYRAGPDPPFLP